MAKAGQDEEHLLAAWNSLVNWFANQVDAGYHTPKAKWLKLAALLCIVITKQQQQQQQQ